MYRKTHNKSPETSKKNDPKCQNFSVWRFNFGVESLKFGKKAAAKKSVRTKIKNIRTIYTVRQDEIFFHAYDFREKNANIWNAKKSRTAIPGLP